MLGGSFQVRDCRLLGTGGVRGVPIPGKVLSPSVSLPGLESGRNLLPLVLCISLFKNLLFSWSPFLPSFPRPPLLCLLELFLVCLILGAAVASGTQPHLAAHTQP